MTKRILLSALILFSYSLLRSQDLTHIPANSGTKFYLNPINPQIEQFQVYETISEPTGNSPSLFNKNGTYRLDSTIYEIPGDEINSWTTDMRITYTYDSIGYIQQRMQYEYTSNGVHIVQKDYTNDSLGRVTNMVQKHCVSGVWVNQWDYDWDYDDSGLLTQLLVKDYYENSWTDWAIYYYSYDEWGHLSEVVNNHWNGNEWENAHVDYYQYDTIGKILSRYSTEWWENSYWVNTFKMDYVYNDSGNLVSLLDYTYWDDSWHLSDTTAWAWDNFNNLAEKTKVQIQNNYGEVLWHYEYFYNNDYSQSDLLLPSILTDNDLYFRHMVTGYNYYWWTDLDSVNTKATYYYTGLDLGLAENIAEDVRIFPNPVGNAIVIECISGNSILSAEIADLKGNTVIRSEYSKQQSLKLDVKRLDPGIYIIRIQTDKGILNKKIVKR